MEVTWAKTKQDLEEIADGMAKVFTRKSYFDFFERRMRYMEYDPWFKPEHSRIIKENGRIVSHVGIIEKPVQIGCAEIRLAGIGDVYTLPQARGKGYSRLLMEDALQYMKEHGFPLTMLYGIPNYYHKFGYLEAVRDFRLEVELPSSLDSNNLFKVRAARETDIPDMLRLYGENFRRLNLIVVRNQEYLRRFLLSPERFLVLEDEQGKVHAYAHLQDEFTGEFLINEAVTSGPEVSLALLEAVSREAPTAESKIPVHMSPGMPFARHVQLLGSKQIVQTFREGQGNGMLAIANLSLLLERLLPEFTARLQHSEFANFSGNAVLKTEEKTVAIVCDHGNARRIVEDREPRAGDPVLMVEKRFFVRNIVGFWQVADLIESGHGAYSHPESARLYDVLFPESQPFMLAMDYF